VYVGVVVGALVGVAGGVGDGVEVSIGSIVQPVSDRLTPITQTNTNIRHGPSLRRLLKITIPTNGSNSHNPGPWNGAYGFNVPGRYGSKRLLGVR
jgi:hypothetical protein